MKSSIKPLLGLTGAILTTLISWVVSQLRVLPPWQWTNSAVFLGVLSDTANIARLKFSSSVPNSAIGINRLSIQTAAIPEPSSAAALLLVGLGMGTVRRLKAREK